MTTLAQSPVDPDQFDLLALIADPWSPATGKPFADRFRAACLEVAQRDAGWVNPNSVRRLLAAASDFNPRQYSASWAGACGSDGFLDKTDVLVPIEGDGSRGNAGKSVPLRRWRGVAS